MSYSQFFYHNSIFCPNTQGNAPLFFDESPFNAMDDVNAETIPTKTIQNAITYEVAGLLDQLSRSMNDLSITNSGKREIQIVRSKGLHFDALSELKFLFESIVFSKRPWLRQTLKAIEQTDFIMEPKHADFTKHCISKTLLSVNQAQSLWENSVTELYNLHLRDEAKLFIEQGLQLYPKSKILNITALKIALDKDSFDDVNRCITMCIHNQDVKGIDHLFIQKCKSLIFSKRESEAERYIEIFLNWILSKQIISQRFIDFFYTYYLARQQPDKAVSLLENVFCNSRCKSYNSVMNYFEGCIKIAKAPNLELMTDIPWRNVYLSARRFEHLHIPKLAITFYDSLLTEGFKPGSSSPPAWFRLRVIIVKKFAQARSQNTSNFVIDPKYFDTYKLSSETKLKTYMFLARVYTFFKDYKNAEDVINNAMKINSSHLELWNRVIELNLAQDKVEEAKVLCSQSITDSKSSYLVHFLIKNSRFNASQEQEEQLYSTLINALEHFPKSGNIYGELARYHLNPLSQYYDLEKAEEFLELGIYYTHQLADLYIELMRLNILKHGFNADLSKIKYKLLLTISSNTGLNGDLWETLDIPSFATPYDRFEKVKELVVKEMKETLPFYIARDPSLIAHFTPPFEEDTALELGDTTYKRLMFAIPYKQIFEMTSEEKNAYFIRLIDQELNQLLW